MSADSLETRVALIEQVLSDLPRKSDLERLRSDLRVEMADLRADMQAIRGEIQAARGDLRAEMFKESNSTRSTIIFWTVGIVMAQPALWLGIFAVAKRTGLLALILGP